MKSIILYALALFLFFSQIGCKKNDIVYTKVGIKKVSVLSFPASNSSNSSWDLLGGYPDLNFTFTEGSSALLYESPSSNIRTNASVTDLPLSWGSSTPFYTHTNLSQKLDVDLWDIDSAIDPDDYMGSVTFDFQSYTSGANKYPGSITITSGALSIKLDLVWQ